MRVLIVGCGYVGIELGALLSARGHEVHGLRRHPPLQDFVRAGITPAAADLLDQKAMARLPWPFDWVVNCAAAPNGESQTYRRTYVDGNRALLDCLERNPAKRLVYTSSTSVYGQDDGGWVDESAPTAPGTPNGDCLVEAEQTIIAARRSQGLPATILRVAGIYGPDRGYWLRQFLNGEARMEGDGGRFLNMIHVEDVAGAIEAVLTHADAGPIYNAGDNAPATQREMFEWLSDRLQRPFPAIVPAGTRRRAVTNKRIDNRKLRQETGWLPKYPTFREGYEALLRTIRS